MQIEVWVAVDEDGDYTVSKDKEIAAEYYNDEIGGVGSLRLICVTLVNPEPKVAQVICVMPPDQVKVTATVKSDS
jgi:hypothetical protein